MQFAADGSLLSTRITGDASLWNLEASTWTDIACRLAGRNLTREEWSELGPRTIEDRATGDEYPIAS